MERRWPLGLGLLLLLLLLCAPLPPGARAVEVTLMDTSKAQEELGWLLDPPEDGWSEVQQILNGTPLYMYQDCPVEEGRDTDHWLRTNWIYRGEEASRVHVELQFTVRDCKSFPGEAGPLGCKETFNLLYMESDQDVGIQLRRPLFQKVFLPLVAISALMLILAPLPSMTLFCSEREKVAKTGRGCRCGITKRTWD